MLNQKSIIEEQESIYDSIIERHSTWLAVNPIQGCPNDCQYCFMKRNGLTRVKPQILMPHDKVIEEIKNSRFYMSDVPLCFFSKTDIMATPENIEYLMEMLEDIYDSDLYNSIILVTKCFIPERVIDKLKKLQNSGRNVVVYISYSGLDEDIEKGIDKTKALKNFYNLYNAQIKVIHYFRPLIPQNSTYEILDKIIGEVSKYAVASVVTGLKVYEKLKDSYSFWREIGQVDNASEYECIWSGNILEKLQKISSKYNYLIYQSNACALEYALGGSDKYGIYGSDICNNFNMCKPEIREKCKKRSKTCSEEEIINAFERLGYKNVDFTIENKVIFVKGISLSNEEICFFSYLLHAKIVNDYKIDSISDAYWNNNLNGAKQLYL